MNKIFGLIVILAAVGDLEFCSLPYENQNEEFLSTKSGKSVVELMASHTYNNSFVVTNLLNFSRNKYDISPIGEPVNLTGVNANLVFEDKILKTFFFSSIHVSGTSSSDSDHTYQNNISCWFHHCSIESNVIPENMTFKGNYVGKIDPDDRDRICNGVIVLDKIGTTLRYEITNISEIHDNGHNWKKNGKIYSSKKRTILTAKCEDRFPTFLFPMFHTSKFKTVKNSDASFISSFISKSMDQFILTFPFLYKAFAPSPPIQKPWESQYNYVIEETVVLGKNTPAALQLGPIIIQGLDNFPFRKVTAIKGHLQDSSNYFRLHAISGIIYGQCDWSLMKETSHQSTINHSFSFIIYPVGFEVGVYFSESWNLNYVNIDVDLDNINIDILDESFSEALDFLKIDLEEFLQSTIKNSLIGLFNQHFPKSAATTKSTTTDTPLSTISEPSPNETLETDVDENNEILPISISLTTIKSTRLNDNANKNFTAIKSDKI